jgi:hypothetical protein
LNRFTPEQLDQIPIFKYLVHIASTLELAQVSVDPDGNVLITFQDNHEREVFLEAVRWVQTQHKGGKNDQT